jgi:hypothetical protein
VLGYCHLEIHLQVGQHTMAVKHWLERDPTFLMVYLWFGAATSYNGWLSDNPSVIGTWCLCVRARWLICTRAASFGLIWLDIPRQRLGKSRVETRVLGLVEVTAPSPSFQQTPTNSHKPLGRLDQMGYIAMHGKRLGRSPVIVSWNAKMYGASLPINSVATL